MARKTAHLISHSHWDREWYMPYESHHYLLTELMNSLLDTLAQDERYRHFHLDGQTIILEDYLQVHPEKRELLEKYITDGRIAIGPWYVLQDEFLTSSEANVRNLLIGHQDAKRYGTICKIGYFPDSFGNMGQAPQLLKQADIHVAAFGRGVKPTGFDNQVADYESSEYESPYSEMYWEAPDGSRVLGILFANWYSNGNEVPVDPEEAKKFWDKKLADAEKYSSTGELLFMNGCDHQPVQTDLGDALETARRLYPDVDFVHSDFTQYMEALQRKVPSHLVTITGELRSQHTDGWGTLVNTASARIYLKQLNQLGQTLLERGAEPLAALAALTGAKAYPHELLTYAWKTLMQNHPHDSICGCSVDEVHREMVGRFDKSRHMTQAIVQESLQAIAGQIDTAHNFSWKADSIPFAVFNTAGRERSGTVSVELIVAKRYFKEGPNPAALAEQMGLMPLDPDKGQLLDDRGQAIAAKVEDLGAAFGYELPKDKFRQPYMSRKIRLTFEAPAVPALGYRSFAWHPCADHSGQAAPSALKLLENGMANEHVSVTFREDGAYSLTNLKNGHTFHELGIFESCGDIGNEYVFRQPEGDIALTTRGVPAKITLVENEAYRITYEIVHDWAIPAGADERLEIERNAMVPFRLRQAQRSKQRVPLRIKTRISLENSAQGLTVSTSFDNQAKDHRLRVLFPTGLESATHYADSIFEAAQRNNVPAAEWINPSNAQHQQAFISVNDEANGLTIANKGLNEYEVLRDGKNTIAITLLRAVGELGDWGVFPTPEAQCLGEQTVEYAVFPHRGDLFESGAYEQAYGFQIPWFHIQTGIQFGSLPTTYAPLSWQGEGLALSALKLSEQKDLIIRWYNLRHQSAKLDVELHVPASAAYRSDVLERRHDGLALHGGKLSLEAGKAEIVTLAVSDCLKNDSSNSSIDSIKED
ncbi:alpha-mannosidase [Paenibacillus apis]|uniref:Alpha-mannosidase n=1 Tax=Paenibacillus apis TaxID=1792174 RepID=A0A919Y551_9BACL|nr:alpha-mannosidase [Paenibacillus apis]GIO42395.1 alpha-mannosidase [Paenibacillus apis]